MLTKPDGVQSISEALATLNALRSLHQVRGTDVSAQVEETLTLIDHLECSTMTDAVCLLDFCQQMAASLFIEVGGDIDNVEGSHSVASQLVTLVRHLGKVMEALGALPVGNAAQGASLN